MAEETFEDGKQAEEYFDSEAALRELDSIQIEPEQNPTGQPMETVAEIIPSKTEKPKEKEKPKKPDLPLTKQPIPPLPTQSPQAIIPPIQQPPVPPSPEMPPTQPQIQPTQEQPIPQPQLVQEQPTQQTPTLPEQPTFTGIDDYILKNAKQLGKITEQNYIDTSYRNLTAIINGDVQLVPKEQIEQINQLASTAETLQKIDVALKDPTLSWNRKALLKQKCELLGVPFDEKLIPSEPAVTLLAPLDPSQSSPVDSKKVKVKEPKPKGKSNLKIIAASICLFGIVALAVLLLIGALAH